MAQSSGWRARFVEALVIVSSILVAFGIDAGWDSYQERGRERSILGALQADMEANLDEASRVEHYANRVEAATLQFLAIEPDNPESMDEQSAFVILSDLFQLATFAPRNGTVLGADLSVLRSDSLRIALGRWQQGADEVVEDGPVLFDASIELSRLAAPAGTRRLFARNARLLQDSGGRPTQVLVQLRRDEAFVDALLIYRSFRQVNARKVASLRTATEEVIRLLSSLAG